MLHSTKKIVFFPIIWSIFSATLLLYRSSQYFQFNTNAMKIIWKWNAHSRRTNNAREHNSGFDSFFLENIFSGPVFFFACHKKPAQMNTIENSIQWVLFSHISWSYNMMQLFREKNRVFSCDLISFEFNLELLMSSGVHTAHSIKSKRKNQNKSYHFYFIYI